MSKHPFRDVHQVPATDEQIKSYCRWRLSLVLVASLSPAMCLALAPFWVSVAEVQVAYALDLAAALALPSVLVASLYGEYEDVPQSECKNLLNILQLTPEGRQYRLAVLAEGRQFRKGEMGLFRAWNSGISQRAGCRALYGEAEPAGLLETRNNESV